jgi:hypothetical protein
MYGSATLAMVESKACMKTPAIEQIKTTRSANLSYVSAEYPAPTLM